MRKQLIEASKQHYLAHIEKHRINVGQTRSNGKIFQGINYELR